ncbi:hypothetical protein CROQUDRAFT_459773 [Cronartium quercuum f. sp. fusiforme G11]|uniref:Uncharacterized protein n=1 Tax=Cronartium quercuum f. sp. fusiforme G11 TaxID=708437 RepID=A0A9P6NQ92_9BASI|nr:hypothetical protein CROQUDRAFT_459773 [Cronartium quercuum f. sp. fusiforme G11]
MSEEGPRSSNSEIIRHPGGFYRRVFFTGHRWKSRRSIDRRSPNRNFHTVNSTSFWSWNLKTISTNFHHCTRLYQLFLPPFASLQQTFNHLQPTHPLSFVDHPRAGLHNTGLSLIRTET